MSCKLCSSENTKVIYNDKIRDGGLGKFTSENIQIFQCNDCDVIWHENVLSNEDYYESTEYRNSLEGTSDEKAFYKAHDKESLEKFKYTGTEIFRDKIVADIGCGCGAFLDYVQGVSKAIVAIEPSKTYRDVMDKKGFDTFAYTGNAKESYSGKIDVITTFDVIEHVENPDEFVKDIYDLLSENGQAIIGTPTDAPIMRQLLGAIYEKEILFSTQHIWILSEENMKIIAERNGFKNIEFKYFQRYGIDNMLGWIRDKKPNSPISTDIITETFNNLWKSQCSDNKLADYIVMYLKK